MTKRYSPALQQPFRLSRYLIIALSIGAVGASAPSFAAPDDLVIEEVTVTAQRREQSLEDVPLAVSVIGSDTISQNRIDNVLAIADLDPSLNATFGEIGIRGITTFVQGNALQPSTAVYIDGVYLNEGPATIGDLIDVERVEVLRGPQGTLFGRNAAAGALNVTTVMPKDEFGGEIKVGAGDHDLGEVHVILNTPFSDTVAMRTSVFTRDRGGPIENLSGGDDFLEEDRWGLRSRLRWLMSDSITIDLGVDYAKYEGGKGVGPGIGPGIPGFITRTSDLTGLVDTRFLADEDDDEFAQTSIILRDGVPFTISPNEGSRTVGGVSAVVEWAPQENMTFTSVTTLRKFEHELIFHDFASIDTNFFLQPFVPSAFTSSFITLSDNENDEFSQEFRLNMTSGNVDWFVGFNYFNVEYNSQFNLAYPQFVLFFTPGYTGDFSDARTDGSTELESYAVFGDAIIPLTDDTNLSVGLRYSHDEATVTRKQLPLSATNFLYLDTSAGDVNFDDDWNNVSGRLILDHAISEDVMIYGGVSTGYKSGGLNSRVSFGGTADVFDEETSLNTEIGLKATFLDRRVSTNIILFNTEYDDYQFQISDPEVPFNALNLSADAIVRGLEFSGHLQATSNLQFGLSTTYLDEAEFTNTEVDGQGLLGAPELAAVATVDYLTNLLDGGTLRFNLTYSYSDSWRLENVELTGTELTIVALQASIGGTLTGHDLRESDIQSGSYGIMNATVTYSPSSEAWDLRLWATNLTDESYRNLGNVVSSAFGGSAAPAYSRNEPRAWGVDFVYRFGAN